MLAPHAPARVTPRSQPAAMKLRSPAIRPRRRHYPSVAPAPGARRTNTSSPSVRTPNTATGRGGRRRQHPAGREVKAGAVQPALDRAVRHLALRQRHRLVGALVPQRVQRAAGADGGHRALADIHVHRAALADLRPGGTPAPSRPRPPARSPATIACSQRRQARPGPLTQQLRQPGAAIHDRRLRRDGVPGGFMGRDGQVTAPSGRPGFLSVADRSICTSSPVKTLPSSSPAPYPAPIPGGRSILTSPKHHAR